MAGLSRRRSDGIWFYRGAVVLAVLVAAVSTAYALGRLKLLYYFQVFGIGLGELDPTPADCLFESWFVVQNLAFFVVLWWTAVKTRLHWVVAAGVVYALIPIASHYAFLAHDTPVAGWLIAYRHTILKVVPFAVLALVWIVYPRRRAALHEATWPAGRNGLVLFAIVTLSWGISTAKHFGSFDGNLALAEPELYLARVVLDVGDDPDLRHLEQRDDLYLIAKGPLALFIWDPRSFLFGSRADVRIVVVPRSAVVRMETLKPARVQPGERFL